MDFFPRNIFEAIANNQWAEDGLATCNTIVYKVAGFIIRFTPYALRPPPCWRAFVVAPQLGSLPGQPGG